MGVELQATRMTNAQTFVFQKEGFLPLRLIVSIVQGVGEEGYYVADMDEGNVHFFTLEEHWKASVIADTLIELYQTNDDREFNEDDLEVVATEIVKYTSRIVDDGEFL